MTLLDIEFGRHDGFDSMIKLESLPQKHFQVLLLWVGSRGPGRTDSGTGSRSGARSDDRHGTGISRADSGFGGTI